MNLRSLTTSDLARIQKLIERKENLAGQISAIDRQLESFETASGNGDGRVEKTLRQPARRTRARRGRSQRGRLKEKVVAALKSAGKEGVTVKDLASRLGSNYGNITSWFQATGSRMKEIKKVGPAQFAWVG
jgi:predicted phage gp36 major capsid-like protein